ncbi:MAG: glycerate kinase [Clostridia bacterium]|nr:glycerate kinase [Clostridia bacterium]
MNDTLRREAETIVRRAIAAVTPERAVETALKGRSFPGRVYLAAVGKAAWKMAAAAARTLGDKLTEGAVVTKYGHTEGAIPRVACYEGGHPVPDEGGVAGTRAVLDLTRDLRMEDTVLFLLSGGGSALFEKPLIPLAELKDITDQMLSAGSDITEINTVRKRLSGVKGGRFAAWCAPARVITIVLSDVLGDPVDMIASGPAVPDLSTCGEALEVVRRYGIRISAQAESCLRTETPKDLPDTETLVVGSVRELCRAAAEECRALGYTPLLLTDRLCCEAKDAGSFLAGILKTHASDGRKTAFLAGGETVVHLSGTGLGGRNQEMALSAARGIAGVKNAAIVCVGSDGTDGPTDAAGGYADGDTLSALEAKGMSWDAMLENHDAYHALKAVGGLIKTGPTGTNVNDIAVALVGQ